MDRIAEIRNTCRKLDSLEKRITELQLQKKWSELEEYTFTYKKTTAYLYELINGK